MFNNRFSFVFSLSMICFLLCSLLLTQSMYAQQLLEKQINIQWEESPVEFSLSTGEKINTFSFADAAYDLPEHPLPIYATRLSVNKSGRVLVDLIDPVFETLNTSNSSTETLSIADRLNEHLSTDIAIEANTSLERKRSVAHLSFVPLRKNPITGDVERLLSGKLQIRIANGQNTSSLRGNRSYASESVLATGNWYKIAVSTDGVYQIDRALLEELGVSGDVSFSSFGVYGNGGGMLPELAGADKYDDLIQTPVQVEDANGNGLFESGDRVLFYGEAADKWYYNVPNDRYEFEKHLYSQNNYYFINTNASSALNISAAPNAGTPTSTVTAFDELLFHEEETSNLIKGGRRFYGEEFGPLPEQSFNFSVPNILTSEPVNVETRVAARSNVSQSNFTITAGDVSENTANMPLVKAGYEYPFAKSTIERFDFNADSENITVNLTYNKPDVGATAWLDYITIHARRALQFNGTQLLFRDAASLGGASVAGFEISNGTGAMQVWEVSTPDAIQRMTTSTSASTHSFSAAADVLKTYIAFDPSDALSPIAVGNVANQNLHTEEFPDYVIIAHPDFLSAAEQLADHHRSESNLEVKVLTPELIYNEFSGGMQDVAAIRDYMKMLYDRAGTDESKMPRYLLLVGDASFDFRGISYSGENNHNFVPTYESLESIETINSYCTDDFFACLDDTEGDNMASSTLSLDLGVGRLPCHTVDQAQAMVDKIIHYSSTRTLGPWRNNLTFVADDEDSNLHLNHAEGHTDTLTTYHPDYNIDKIYIDAYTQVPVSNGSRYPDVNESINNKVFSGSLMMNYIGHGGENGWAHERILNTNDILKWDNIDQMPVFVTATCSFSRYDNPDKVSAGEYLLINPDGGAVGVITTVRLVYASSNKRLNGDLVKRMFRPMDNGEMPTLGDMLRLTKNDAAITKINNRKFVLLGDPAMKMHYPKQHIRTLTVNGQNVSEATDTIKALSKVTITGEVTNENEQRLEDFNGTLHVTVFDKAQELSTLGNDPNSSEVNFDLHKAVVFQGRASVTNGEFSFEFIVPKDISYQYGQGRISYYAENGDLDANGADESLTIGGIVDGAATDDEGPTVEVFMNDENFVLGGLTNADPVILVKLHDESGINTVGTGIGHDITAQLDDDPNKLFVLNKYYNAEKDSYQTGMATYPLSDIEEGLHTINVKAWDVFNNSGKGYTEFVVAESADIALDHVLNYPNPFIDNTSFWFEHNKAGDELFVTVRIMNISGRVVKTIQQQIIPDGFRVDNIHWDGRDDFGEKIGRGTYIYELRVRDSANNVAREVQKLVILK